MYCKFYFFIYYDQIVKDYEEIHIQVLLTSVPGKSFSLLIELYLHHIHIFANSSCYYNVE